MPKRGYGAAFGGGAGAQAAALKRSRVSGGVRMSPYINVPRLPRIPARLNGFVRYGGAWNRFGGNSRQKELKFFETAMNDTFDSTAVVPGTGGQISLIPQGDTATSRDGRQCVVKSVQLRAQLSFTPASASAASTNVWLALVQDTQCNGAAAAVTDVFTSASMASNFHNLNNSQRFRVLAKKHLKLTSTGGVGSTLNNVTAAVDIYRKVNIPLVFSSTTGAITELRSNNMFWILGSDVGSDDSVAIEGTTRLRFSDSQ